MCDTSTFIPTQLHLKNEETNETVKVDLETELSSTVSQHQPIHLILAQKLCILRTSLQFQTGHTVN